MGGKNARRVTWLLTSLSALLIAAGVLLGALAIFEGGKSVGLLSHQLTIPISGAVFAAMGALVLPRYPRHPIAWMLVGLGVITGVEVLGISLMATMSLEAPGEIIHAPDLVHWLRQWIYYPRILVPITLLLLLFPSGKLPSRRWRLLAWVTVLGIAVSTAANAFTPGSRESLGGIIRNPFGLQSQLLEPARILSNGLLAIALIACPASMFIRFRKSKGIERQQLKWITYAVAAMLLLFVVSGALFVVIPDKGLATELGFSMHNVAVIGIAIAVSIAILRYRLYDIDLLINRTLVYGVLTASVVIIYVLVVGALGALLKVEGNVLISLVATGVIAVLFQPMRERVQRGVNRIFYGQRDDPLGALSQLGRRLEATMAPEVVLPTLVETIAQTMKLPYVAISLRSGDEFKIAAQCGDMMEDAIKIPLNYQGETVGQLIAGPRGPGESFGQADRQLLENIAHQAGPAAYAVQLTQDLRQSRVRLVTAREEERRRLRRDLHDGLGPVLASQGLKMAAASRLLEADPEKAQRLLEEMAAQNETTVSEIRRLVYELRPAILDDLGLVGAVRDYAAGLKGGAQDSARLQVDVQAPAEGLPPLPAATEVAAYRIATEALTNVARHARAHHASVCFEPITTNSAARLHLEILDDGLGLPANYRAGIGLISMRERAEEVGGIFLVESRSGRGARVEVDLPLANAA